jgi:hypothetical protein
MRARAAESPDNNVVLVARKEAILRAAPQEEIDRCRAAVVEEEVGGEGG